MFTVMVFNPNFCAINFHAGTQTTRTVIMNEQASQTESEENENDEKNHPSVESFDEDPQSSPLDYSHIDSDVKDPDYVPSDSSDEESENEDMDMHTTPCYREKKYIIFWSCLMKLLVMLPCPSCGFPDLRIVKNEIGSMVILHFLCQQCGADTPWKSQPYMGDYPAGNLLISAAILYTGSIASKVLRVFKHIGVATITERTFFAHQKKVGHSDEHCCYSVFL